MSRHHPARPKVTTWPTLEQLIHEEGGACWLCRGKYGPVTMANASRDHVICKSRGGKNERWNLRLAHDFCNRNRGDKKVSQKAIQQALRRREHLVAKQRSIREEWRQHIDALQEGLTIPGDFFSPHSAI